MHVFHKYKYEFCHYLSLIFVSCRQSQDVLIPFQLEKFFEFLFIFFLVCVCHFFLEQCNKRWKFANFHFTILLLLFFLVYFHICVLYWMYLYGTVSVMRFMLSRLSLSMSSLVYSLPIISCMCMCTFPQRKLCQNI